MKLTLVLEIGFLSFGATCGIALAQADWEKHLAWSSSNTGVPDCPAFYNEVPGGSACLAAGIGGGTGVGNRSCLMSIAKGAAQVGDADLALRIALICQCHNPGAQRQIQTAGATAVATWLKAH